jgi:hypothetical protein
MLIASPIKNRFRGAKADNEARSTAQILVRFRLDIEQSSARLSKRCDRDPDRGDREQQVTDIKSYWEKQDGRPLEIWITAHAFATK